MAFGVKWYLGVVAGIVITCASGCILVPVLDSVSQVGITEGDRTRLLGQEVKRFNDNRYWGNMQGALSSVAEDAVAEIRPSLSQLREGEKLVESKVAESILSPDAYEGTIIVTHRIYSLQTLIVESRKETQQWKFSLKHGWKVYSLHTEKV